MRKKEFQPKTLYPTNPLMKCNHGIMMYLITQHLKNYLPCNISDMCASGRRDEKAKDTESEGSRKHCLLGQHHRGRKGSSQEHWEHRTGTVGGECGGEAWEGRGRQGSPGTHAAVQDRESWHMRGSLHRTQKGSWGGMAPKPGGRIITADFWSLHWIVFTYSLIN